MSTSNKRLVAEAAGSAVLAGSLIALLSPGDPWLQDFGFHPAWIPVFALTARYGPAGVYLGLGMHCAALAAVGLATGAGVDGLFTRASRPGEPLVLLSALLVAWTAMAQRRRLEQVAAREHEALEAHARARETLEAMRASIQYLRDRCDRIDLSVGVWRELAGRIERGSYATAARAVLELCAIRFGATAGAVQLFGTANQSTIAWQGRWTSDALRPHDLCADRTVRAAVVALRPLSADRVAGTSPDDSCVAVPLIDSDDGFVIGVLALRLRDTADVREVELMELGVVADWLAPRLVAMVREPRLRAVPEGGTL